MKNLIILGSSRSGTSLTAGLFSKHYFQGEELLPPTISNPYGYYEDRNINLINNEIIKKLVNWPILNRLRKKLSFTFNSDQRAYPMAAPIKINKKIKINGQLASEIRKYTDRRPFCYKDPRFNITLPYWTPFLHSDVRFICVFRDPYRTADSQLRNAREVYSPPIPITLKECNISWYRNYKRILFNYAKRNNWLFVNYDMIITLRSIPAIENFAESKVDISKINSKISRSEYKKPTNHYFKYLLNNLFKKLQQRACIDNENWSNRDKKSS